MGIRVHLGADTSAVLGRERVSGLEFKNGESLECDLVVFATGIKPNAEIAQPGRPDRRARNRGRQPDAHG